MGDNHRMKTPRIVVVGSINTDMVVKGARLPSPGATVTGGRFMMAGGGKGANQAVAAARLGAQVTLVGKVGADLFGDQARLAIQKEGIATDWIFRDPHHSTGVALILVDESGENLISVASGANHALMPADIEQAADCLRAADIVLLQLEVPFETVLHSAKLASEAGATVILDPAPAPDAPLDAALLRCVAYVKPNESEAERLTGIAVRDEQSARKAADKLLQAGARNVIITLGASGALWANARESSFEPAHAVEAIDSTAAGDAFSGGLACALARGVSLAEAVRQANLVAALCVTRLGAQPSLPTADEVNRFIRSM
jgi:ribokinase